MGRQNTMTKKTIHAELTCLAFQYAIKLIAEGSRDEAIDLGLTDESLQWICSLTAADLQRLKDIRFSAVVVEFDEDALNRLKRLVEHRKRDEEEEAELLRLGANLVMMRKLCGIGGAEYARRRRSLGLCAGVGRPAALDEEQHQRLWHAWRASAGLPGKARYITIGRGVGIPLGSVWACVQQWESAVPQLSGEERLEKRCLS